MAINYKEARKRLGMTQSDVARAVGVSLNAYQMWEHHVGKPNPEHAVKVRKVLELNEDK